MDRPASTFERVERAAEIVCDYLLGALPPHTQGVSLDDILFAAESIWNNYEPGAPPLPYEEMSVDLASPAFRALVERLHRARGERYQHARFFIFALDYGYDDPDVVFACDVRWPNEADIHSFEVRVERASLSPPACS